MRLFLFILLFSITLASHGQKHTFTGTVFLSDEKPAEGANVAIEGSVCGATTDSKGKFSFTCTSDFPVRIVVSMIGYGGAEKIVTSAQACHNLTFTLSPTDKMIEKVDVKGRRRNSDFQKIDATHARLITDASGGIESLLKTQMGVSSNSELSSQYRVRGGNFDENMVYVNNTEIYRPFLIRSGEQEGLSFVNPDLVESLDFSSGGFDVSYGDRMSSVLDVKYKKPQKSAASIQGGLLGASGHLEGNSLKGKLTHVTGVRYKTNQYLLGTLDMKGDYAPSFLDGQTFLTFSPSSKLTFDILGYYAQNRYRFVPQNRETSFGTISEVKKLKIYFEGEEDDRYQTGLVAGAVNFTPQKGHLLRLSGGIYRSFEEENFDILGEYWLQEIIGGETNGTNNEMENIGVGGYLQHARNELLGVVNHTSITGRHSVNAHLIGWELKYQHEKFKDYINEWELRDSAGYSVPGNNESLKLAYAYNASLNTRSNRVSGYLKDNIIIELNRGILRLNYGIRASWWDFNGEWNISPRVNVSFTPASNENLRYRLAAGIYYQSPFYREIRNSAGEINKNIKSQKSAQLLAATDLFFHLGDQPFKFTAEGYYKHLTRLIPYQIDNVRIRYSGENNARGYSAGLDLKLNGEFVPGVESWASVSILKTVEDIDDDSYVIKDKNGNQTVVYPGYLPRPSDQRVNFSIFFQDYLPNNPTLRIHMNMLYGTGLPFGPPNSERYKAVNRMPSYRRMDMGLTQELNKYLNTGQSKTIKNAMATLEVFNMFNFSNTISYFWVTDVSNRQYAVPNYLTSRRFNLKLTLEF